MSERLFRLTELHLKIDRRLRLELARRRPDRSQVSRLRSLRARVKQLLARLMPRLA